ncbi:MAG: response regulator [Bacteroidota bacterium]|nr:response regulator [Bacteroidota bacterium]
MDTTILIIEDNQELRENAEEILHLANYKVLSAENGKAGLELIRNNNPDLILCDIKMPELDGYSVLRALDNIPDKTGIPFIFMTACSGKADFRKGMDLGADDYIIKPLDAETILRVVDKRLKKYNSIKTMFEHKYVDLDGLVDENKSQKGIKTLSNNKIIKKLRKKDVLFFEDNPANFLYLILSGKIKTSKSNEFGREVIIDIHREGDFLGYFSLLEGGNHNVSAIAIEDTEVEMIPKQDFYQALSSDNNITLKFAKLMSNKFSSAEEKLLKMAYDSARKRVAEAIIFAAKRYNDDKKEEICFNLNRENISALSGISPESVSRNLTCFKEEGLIETYNGSILIKDMKKLATLKN